MTCECDLLDSSLYSTLLVSRSPVTFRSISQDILIGLRIHIMPIDLALKLGVPRGNDQVVLDISGFRLILWSWSVEVSIGRL